MLYTHAHCNFWALSSMRRFLPVKHAVNHWHCKVRVEFYQYGPVSYHSESANFARAQFCPAKPADKAATQSAKSIGHGHRH